MQNMEAVLAGIRVQKDRAMKDLSYARKEGNPTKVEEFQKKVALIDAQIKEIQEQFPKFKEQKKNDPGRKVNFSDVDEQLNSIKKEFGFNPGKELRDKLGFKEQEGYLAKYKYNTDSKSSDINELKNANLEGYGIDEQTKKLNDEVIKNNRTGDIIETGTNAALGAAGLYGLYKLYRSLKNKKNRTPVEEQQMQEAKGKLDAAKQK